MKELQEKLGLALTHHQAGKLQKAKQLYQKILKVDPHHNDAQHMLGLVSHQSGDNETAIRLYNSALKDNQESPELFTNLGNALQSTEKYEEAISAFQQAIKLNPQFALALSNLGNALIKVEKTEEAIGRFQEAVNLLPNFAQAHCNLGNAFYANKEPEKAISSFREAIKIEPDYTDALRNLAKLLMDKQETDEAIGLFKRVLQLDENDELSKHLLAALEGKTTTTAPSGYVIKLFDSVADSFDQHLLDELAYKVPQYFSDEISRLVDNKDQELDVLDLGCGTGLCGPYFKSLAKKITGVDLSPNMLAKAKELNVYDKLVLGDITKELKSSRNAFDIILAADVFIYVGELIQTFKAAAAALKPEGLFAFSLEAILSHGENKDTPYVLRPTGRYAHSLKYVRELAAKNGLKELSFKEDVLRMDNDKPINGYILVLGKN